MSRRLYSTPEEAARGDIPSQFVRVVGVVLRDDQAVVAQLTNDKPPYEVETARCSRESGSWVAEGSGNSTSAYMPLSELMGTSVVWSPAPADAVAARFVYKGREQVVSVEAGCALAAFDDVPVEDGFLGLPHLAAWIDASANETQVPWHGPPERFRDKISELLARRAQPN